MNNEPKPSSGDEDLENTSTEDLKAILKEGLGMLGLFSPKPTKSRRRLTRGTANNESKKSNEHSASQAPVWILVNHKSLWTSGLLKSIIEVDGLFGSADGIESGIVIFSEPQHAKVFIKRYSIADAKAIMIDDTVVFQAILQNQAKRSVKYIGQFVPKSLTEFQYQELRNAINKLSDGAD